MLHSRQTRRDFSRIVDRVKNRLAGWKANSLSMAGMVTLAKSVVSINALLLHAIY